MKFSIIIFILSLIVIVTWSCEKDKTYKVEYVVNRTNPLSDTNNYLVTFYDQNAKVVQDTCYNGSWQTQFIVNASHFIYVSAFPPDTVTELTVSILIDDVLYNTKTGKGILNPKYNRIADGITIFGTTPQSN
jgi:hypothetical protein